MDMVEDLLPNIVPLKGKIDIFESLTDCYYSAFNAETRGPVLAFSTAIANIGKGPLHLVIGEERVEGKGERIAPATQRIFNINGGFRERHVGLFTLHEDDVGNKYWFLKNFESYTLLNSDGYIIARDKKKGFCMVDSVKYSSIPGSPESRQYYQQGCFEKKVAGLSVGWLDAYAAEIGGNYIDI